MQKDKKPKKGKNFRVKVSKLLIFIAIIPLFLITLFNFYQINDSQQANILKIQELALGNAQEKIKKFFTQKFEILHLVVNTDLGASPDEFREEAKLLTDGLTVNAAPTTLTEISPETLNSLIDSIYAMSQDTESITFVDKFGNEIARRPAGPNENMYNLSMQEIFQKTIRGENYIGPVIFGPDKPTIKLASQIENSNKETIGIIIAEVNLTPIRSLIGEITLGNSGFVYITDDQANIIASSNSNFQNKAKELEKIPQINLVIKGGSESKLEEYNNPIGDKVVFSGKLLDQNLGWFVFSEWPKSDAYSILYKYLYQSALITLLTLVVVIFISLYSAKQVVQPIEKLAAGSEQIKQGNLEFKVDIKTNDEFEELAEEFNEMINVLNENKKLKDEFVFIAAHELRTPVTAIKGYISMALEGTFGDLSDTLKNTLNTVFASNERLVQLVQDLLEVARSESGKMKIEAKSVPYNENFQTVIRELEPLAAKKNIKILYDEPRQDMNVLADANKLKEVLVNLIGNAVKYTLNDGDIHISHEIKGGEVTTYIKDHGIGIDEESVKKLFSKFYRVKTEQTEQIEGTGLGLFICKEIIERMGGRIWAESKVGQGSTFAFTLKLANSLQ